ncbi:hypothetical protein WUBG_19265, partial [Wuchereria bancrofti]
MAILSGSKKPETLISSTNVNGSSISCGGILKAQPYGQIFTSPDYPKNYPSGVECVWKIDADPGQLISLD